MAWSNSKIFRPFLADVLGNIAALDCDADSFKIALYTNAITPDNDVTSANSAYNVAVWGTANEQFEAGQWAQGGVALGGQSLDSSIADTVFFDGSDTASGAAADLTNVYGCLDYDDTIAAPVADQGMSYRYFGGANTIVNGTFTVVHHTNGLWRVSL